MSDTTEIDGRSDPQHWSKSHASWEAFRRYIARLDVGAADDYGWGRPQDRKVARRDTDRLNRLRHAARTGDVSLLENGDLEDGWESEHVALAALAGQ